MEIQKEEEKEKKIAHVKMHDENTKNTQKGRKIVEDRNTKVEMCDAKEGKEGSEKINSRQEWNGMEAVE